MCWQIEHDLGSGPLAPELARTLVGADLDANFAAAGPSEIADDARLVVSELVTNAVVAGSQRVQLALCLHRRELTIAVSDDGTGWPMPRPSGQDAQHGRGLVIVAALARAWGVVRIAENRKQVWASLSVPEYLTTSLRCDVRVV